MSTKPLTVADLYQRISLLEEELKSTIMDRKADLTLHQHDVLRIKALTAEIERLKNPLSKPVGSITFELPQERLRLEADGAIFWRGQRLDTAPEIGKALHEFVKAMQESDGEGWKQP